MKLDMVSDTHAENIDEIPPSIGSSLADVDLIHAGDFIHKAVLDALRTTGKVKAVRGNMDLAGSRESCRKRKRSG